ncbi:MAG: LysM peptidoglycan-binding domain-containing protein [Thermomicrobiales bacterium]|jgi:LysM repeat protein|nr:LysM peptidoglycan-binding domain-containing protein [Thermomicrobiales bacterium]
MVRLGKFLITAVLALTVLVACSIGGDSEESNGDASATIDEVLQIVTLTPAPSATVRTELVDYVVGEGDTLSGIADEFGVSQQSIIDANGLPNPNAIFVGQTLMIPAPTGDGSPES